MVSIKNSLSELDRAHRELDTAVDSYKGLISHLAEHTAGLDNENTAAVRISLESIALSVRSAPAGMLPEFNLRIKGLLQEYSKRITSYVANLQQERVRTERVLKELAASLTQADDDHDGRIRKTVDTLRTLARSPDARAIRAQLATAAESIEQSVDKIRKEHQHTIAQFHTEIRALQRKLGAGDSPDEADSMARVYSRPEIVQKMTAAQPGQYVVLIIKARGLRLAAVQFSPDVADQLGSAFLVRMRNILPPSTLIGRWSEEEFVAAIHSASAPSTTLLCRTVAESLPGGYACTQDGKPARAYVEVTVCAADNSVPAQLPERIEASLARI